MLTRYFGPTPYSVFGSLGGTRDDKYVIFGVDNKLYAYHLVGGSIKCLTHWKEAEVAKTLKNQLWHQFTVAELETFIPGQIVGVEIAGVKSFFESSPNAKFLIDKPTVDGQGFIKVKSKQKTKMAVIGQQPVSQNVVDTTPRTVTRGQLYYNLAEKQVQRIIEIQGHLYWASYHKQAAKPYGIKSFRKATKAEVDSYLANAN